MKGSERDAGQAGGELEYQHQSLKPYTPVSIMVYQGWRVGFSLESANLLVGLTD